MDTCAMTSTLRERCRPRPALAVRWCFPSSRRLVVRAYLNADMDPNSNPDRTERARVKPSERASREISLRRGRLAGPIADEQTQARNGYTNGNHAAQESERDALDQQLARDAHAAGA